MLVYVHFKIKAIRLAHVLVFGGGFNQNQFGALLFWGGGGSGDLIEGKFAVFIYTKRKEVAYFIVKAIRFVVGNIFYLQL